MKARFSVPSGPALKTYPASCTMDNGSLPGVKRSGRGADCSHPSSIEAASGLALYLNLLSLPVLA